MSGGESVVEKVFLTEIRDDLKESFYALPFPKTWFDKIEYFQGDAFNQLQAVDGLDFILVDGKKSDYLKFINASYEKLNQNGVIVIDNAFWKGSVIEDGVASKSSTESIRKMHMDLQEQTRQGKWSMNYFPFRDGLIVLKKI